MDPDPNANPWSESGSISQKHGSEDPDPPQNVMEQEHLFQYYKIILFRLAVQDCPVEPRWPHDGRPDKQPIRDLEQPLEQETPQPQAQLVACQRRAQEVKRKAIFLISEINAEGNNFLKI